MQIPHPYVPPMWRESRIGFELAGLMRSDVWRGEGVAEASGQKVAIVGQSRGGSFARVLAVRRPDLVSGIVTLGAPLKHQLAVHPLVRAGILGIGVLGTAGLDGLMRHSCLWGDCCTEYWEHFGRDFPSGVGFVSIYSRSDGIVKWKACLDPAAEHVEVRASHIGMAVNAEVYG